MQEVVLDEGVVSSLVTDILIKSARHMSYNIIDIAFTKSFESSGGNWSRHRTIGVFVRFLINCVVGKYSVVALSLADWTL